MEVSPKGPLSHLQCQVYKHLRARAIKLPNGVGEKAMVVEGSVSRVVQVPASVCCVQVRRLVEVSVHAPVGMHMCGHCE